MKKTLIALAAVAATGAAMAQSTVTLSGVMDVGFQKRWSGDALQMISNRNGTSNWTLSGSEDLGGGLKANFKISTSFNVDDGTLAAANALGNNDMWVGLSGDFGTIRAGRPVNTLYGNALLANGTKGISSHDANSVITGLTLRGANASNGGSVYVNNAVQYHSPVMSGFQVQLEYAPEETNAAAGQDAMGIALRYAQGPLVVSLTNYKEARTTKLKAATQLAAAYDFGVARVLFTWRDQGGLASTQDVGYALGVTAPVGPGTVYASYNVSEQVGTDGRTFIAGYKYNLSKRTVAYAQIGNRNAAWASAAVTAGGGNGAKSSTGYGFGLQHSF